LRSYYNNEVSMIEPCVFNGFDRHPPMMAGAKAMQSSRTRMLQAVLLSL